MDYYAFFMEFLYNPLWFVWDIAGTVGILFMVKKWIGGSVTDTKTQVVEAIKDPVGAKEVREAWGIPTKEEIKAEMETSLKAFDIASQAALDARLGGLLEDIQGGVQKVVAEQAEKPLNIQLDADSLSTEIAKGVSAHITGMMGAETKEAKKEYNEARKEYEESGGAEEEVEGIAKMLEKNGCPPMFSKILARRGPKAIEGWIREQVGPGEARRIIQEYRAEKMKGGGLKTSTTVGGWSW